MHMQRPEPRSSSPSSPAHTSSPHPPPSPLPLPLSSAPLPPDPAAADSPPPLVPAARQRSMAQAVAEVVRPHSTQLDHAEARARLREAVVSYVHELRAQGAHVGEIVTAINAVVRRTLAGAVPARVADELRDTVRRWTRAVYERAD